LNTPVLVTLQGDDVFLESLPEPYRSRALAEIRRLAAAVDGFLVHSRFYADFMQEYFGLSPERIVQVPLGIDVSDFVGSSDTAPEPSLVPKIGYVARLAPEKGLHTLVDAFLELRRMPGMEQVRLEIAGWLGDHQRTYVEEQFAKLRAAGLADAFRYAGAPDRRQKIEFLKTLNLFSVPTQYREPKGLYVLEALAAGVPVVQPAHGAFPELLTATGGGRLVLPENSTALAQAWHDLLKDADQRRRLGHHGQRIVRERYNAEAMARGTLEVLGRYGRFKGTCFRS
jgi:glycosyltransferase involved in cell wall biosynthesis